MLFKYVLNIDDVFRRLCEPTDFPELKVVQDTRYACLLCVDSPLTKDSLILIELPSNFADLCLFHEVGH